MTKQRESRYDSVSDGLQKKQLWLSGGGVRGGVWRLTSPFFGVIVTIIHYNRLLNTCTIMAVVIFPYGPLLPAVIMIKK